MDVSVIVVWGYMEGEGGQLALNVTYKETLRTLFHYYNTISIPLKLKILVNCYFNA